MKTTTLPLKNLRNRSSCQVALLLILSVLASFALAPQARAVCQEGCLTNNNTVLGEDALVNNTGVFNTAIGVDALQFNTTGSANAAIGHSALFSNTTGNFNTAAGDHALFSNTTGNYNTATGSYSLWLSTTGTQNTAIGYDALFQNTTGSSNTATGSGALGGPFPMTGNSNTATGVYALVHNRSGNNNTATGVEALFHNRNGNNNTATGVKALLTNISGSSNIALGFDAGKNLTDGSNNIDIGNVGVAAEANTIRIGTEGTQTNAYVAGISGVTVPNGVGVIIDTNGHLGTVVCSERFKDEIRPMEKASEAILALQPVSFRYKKDLDPNGIPQFGLVAGQVEKANPDLVVRDDQGRPFTVRYEAVNAMLLNEFLKEHRKVEQLTKEFESKLAEQRKQIQQLIAGLQKVNAQLELSKSALQTVLNDQ